MNNQRGDTLSPIWTALLHGIGPHKKVNVAIWGPSVVLVALLEERKRPPTCLGYSLMPRAGDSYSQLVTSTVQGLLSHFPIMGSSVRRPPLLQGPQGIGFISTCRDSPLEVSVAPSNQLSLQTALNTDCLRKTAPRNQFLKDLLSLCEQNIFKQKI